MKYSISFIWKPAAWWSIHLLPASEGAHDHGGLVLQDVNFDGYLDFRVMRAMAASPNIPFWFYLYDPAAKAFRRHPALDPVSAPEIDPKGKTLTSTTRASATEYETNVYGWQGGELVVLRRTQKRYLSESEYDETTFERKGGSLQKVGTRRVKED